MMEDRVLAAAHIAFLTAHRVGHLATADTHGRPHVVPVCYAVHGGRLYIAIDEKPKRVAPEELRRLRDVRANPWVCLVVDDYDEDWSRLAWLQVRGRAEHVDDPAERSAALAALRARYRQYRAMDLESRPLLGITPTRVISWHASAAAPGAADRSAGSAAR
jgi:PPOX class probable F420-dependent enzyme